MSTSSSTHVYSRSVIGGGGHLFFSTRHFLGREVSLWDIPASAVAATTGAAMLSPIFSTVVDGSWFKKVERLLDPSVVKVSRIRKN